ncbi:hypothetical protein BGX26_011211 [Mortierella sp. AD094]|nr:hypothetical protein BGX26_011211 [Mortierella sp. AD094]
MSYERLEILGDAVLEYAVTEHYYKRTFKSHILSILVHNCDSPSYGYELVVAPTLERFRYHVKRAEHYVNVRNTENMFVVNLCPKPDVDYFEETPEMPELPEMPEMPEMNVDYSEETTSVKKFSRLANKVRSCYAENLQQPPKLFVFPADVTVVNVIIREGNEMMDYFI